MKVKEQIEESMFLLEGTIEEAIKKLTDKKTELEREGIENVFIDIYVDEFDEIKIRFNGQREETAKEKERRLKKIKKEKEMKENWKQYEEEQERKQYEILKKKFEK